MKSPEDQLQLPLDLATGAAGDFRTFVAGFDVFGTETRQEALRLPGCPEVPVFINEFWTAKQRAAHSLHEVSYRACFKPQLPRFFIDRLTSPGAVVYDPFLGRGTTLLEAAFMGRIPWGCDINPLSAILVRPRLAPPKDADLLKRIKELDLSGPAGKGPDELLVFYHPKVLQELCWLRGYFARRIEDGTQDAADDFVQMVATNRLTGHSPGFFSVYSMPPNQAVSVKSQTRINQRRGQSPPVRDIRGILMKKGLQLLQDLTDEQRAALQGVSRRSRILTGSCDSTPQLPDKSVDLVVTSPPFLAEVDYRTDNWLRCWFNGIDQDSVHLWMLKKPDAWQNKMRGVLAELGRVLKPDGRIAFEVGEVPKLNCGLENFVIPAGIQAGLVPELVLINEQDFTKTSNCWGVSNKKLGTNTNRIVLFRK